MTTEEICTIWRPIDPSKLSPYRRSTLRGVVSASDRRRTGEELEQRGITTKQTVRHILMKSARYADTNSG